MFAWLRQSDTTEPTRAEPSYTTALASVRHSLHLRTSVRLFFTVWLVYCVHLSTNVARETYLATSLGDHLSVRVDAYLGLHPDLFEIPGRGGYINNNPGASMLGAIPYALARPAIALLFTLKPELGKPKPPARYDDPRPNRTAFMNEARRRGVDVKLGLAAIATQVGLMAPLGALAAVLVFLFLRGRLDDPKRALAYALLFAFGTPFFFRAAFLNQNAIVAHCVLWAYVAITGLEPRRGPLPLQAVTIAGACLGFAILTDYSGAPLAFAFGVWVMAEGWADARQPGALRNGARFLLGAAGPVAILFAYQWVAFGHPLLPAQRYMPATPYSVKGWFGMTPPTPYLLFGNLFGLEFGLFGFCPMLVAALAYPLVRRRTDLPGVRTEWFVLGAGLLLYLFSSSNQYANLQWNTGVRYMVPLVPLLFFMAVPVLERLPRLWFWMLVLPTCTISWCVSMTRENVVAALTQVFLTGLKLPILTVLRKMASGYLPLLAERAPSPIPIFLLMGAILWLVWRDSEIRSSGR